MDSFRGVALLLWRAGRPAFILLSIIASLASSGRAWENHEDLTRLALEGDPALQALVAVESFEDFTAATKYKTPEGFLRAFQLNPTVRFNFIAGETPGGKIPILRILEAYAKEPDAGMDWDIFKFYPELWKGKYRFIGGKTTGPPSQAFRHMYWPGGYTKLLWKLPIPVHDTSPLGQAPDRARLFFDASVRAAKSGHPYWAARLLTWSLHYLQDVNQPFHSAQIPSKKFRAGFSVKGTINRLLYYHVAYEHFIAALVSGEAGLPGASSALRTAVGGRSMLSFPEPGILTRMVAHHSHDYAKRLGAMVYRFFPRLDDPKKAFPEELLRDPDFWKKVHARAAADPALQAEFIEVTRPLMKEFGEASRRLVDLFRQETLSSAPVLACPLPSSDWMDRYQHSQFD